MITQIDISSFRSIKKQEIPIKKFNILYGPNGSGKSSVMYAAYVIRNFFVNPGQQLNRLFNLGFINLGGFDNVIYNKDYRPITISITSDKNFIGSDKILCKLTVVIEDFLNSEISYNIDEFEATLSIDFPFTAVEKKEVTIGNDKFLWNGLTFEKLDKKNSERFYASKLNSIYQDIKSIEAISVKRGFFSPIFFNRNG